MTQSPLLVLTVLAFFLFNPASRMSAATKASQPAPKRAAKIPKAQAAGDEPVPAVPKALAPTPDQLKAATPATPPGAEEVPAVEEGPPAKPAKKPALVSTMEPEELADFDTYPPALQEVVRQALELTKKNLRYQFGSSDPKSGGMDCSGTMCRVLNDAGIKDVPRQSDEICRWVMRHSVLYRTEDTASLKNAAYSALRPGSLLFWTGTYDTGGKREIPVSHVMLYLGKRKKDGKPIVFGSSDGRTFEGERRNGVSVFDFSLPRRGEKSAFYGYGPIPHMPGEEIRRAIPRAVPVPRALPVVAAQ